MSRPPVDIEEQYLDVAKRSVMEVIADPNLADVVGHPDFAGCVASLLIFPAKMFASAKIPDVLSNDPSFAALASTLNAFAGEGITLNRAQAIELANTLLSAAGVLYAFEPVGMPTTTDEEHRVY